ncbi:hypothetical protein N4T77_11865 [Clostridium sp. CX1]|uniref:DUF6873 family GME fold protein n=1 Tax=Clostridium sp. CX1 TaxID=2978346 RepID=UPI0021C12956|nr:hypothetical protein [Clostridium sp. CX1]MCT8977301.1 hypothetical protein [Clostridium sp. CX1]
MKYAIVDFRITEEEKYNITSLGYKTIICPPSQVLYEAVCGHPDMLLHILDKNKIVVHKGVDKNFIALLKNLGFSVLLSGNELKDIYPHDIILNSVSLSNLFMHNIKYTDPELLKLMTSKKLINVKQGYSKCSTAIVTEKAVMTSDKSIAKALITENIDVLLLPPGDIELPNLNYGFIGGCCGLLNENTLAFYGDLNYYAYGNEVLSFLKKHNVKPVYLRKDKLIDRGSLFVIEN